MKATTTADVVLEKLKQIEREHEEKLAAWDAERNAATAARRYFGRPQPCGRTPRVAELAERLGISRAGLNALLKPLLAEHRVEVYKRVGAHDGIASVKDDTRDRALAVDARRREIAVLRTMAEDWVKAHEYNPIFNVEVRMDRDEKGEPLPGRVLLEITTSCSDENMISLLEVIKKKGDER